MLYFRETNTPHSKPDTYMWNMQLVSSGLKIIYSGEDWYLDFFLFF